MNVLLNEKPLSSSGGETVSADRAERICEDLQRQGYSIQPSCLPVDILGALQEQVMTLDESEFFRAGVGRSSQHHTNDFVRSDEVCWMTGETPPSAAWLEWAEALRIEINRRLFMGLFSFESHYAWYRAGAYYKRHYDAFRGQTNRIVSVVAYLNSDWAADDGGELVLYKNAEDREGLRVTPLAGTVVVFLSEDFPHEVLPAKRDRFSIAGWYRVNSSNADVVDPPR